MQNFSGNLVEALLIYKIDLVRGYYQITVANFSGCLLGSTMVIRPSSGLWTQSVEVSSQSLLV